MNLSMSHPWMEKVFYLSLEEENALRKHGAFTLRADDGHRHGGLSQFYDARLPSRQHPGNGPGRLSGTRLHARRRHHDRAVSDCPDDHDESGFLGLWRMMDFWSLFGHLKWTPAIAAGYVASILVHMAVNSHYFSGR